MNTIEAILGRRTAHFYTPEAVDESAVQRALACAIRAPNHKLTNPWRFTRIGAETHARLVEIALELKARKRVLSASESERIRAKVGSAPVLIAVSQVLSDDPMRRKEDYASVSCAIQNYCLAMWDAGYATKWSTGGWTSDPRTYTLLGIDAEREELVGCVMAGHAADETTTQRLPVGEVYREIP